YSRFIPWMFVGLSALTERAVVEQYLNVVDKHKYLPMIMRSDRGTETTMTAAVHYWLSTASKNSRKVKVRRNAEGKLQFTVPTEDGEEVVELDQDAMDDAVPVCDPETPLHFSDCWKYGKSTLNQ